MAPIPKGGRVAVTGASGFIGGWVVKKLLDAGYRVRACVRDVNDEAKCGFLKALPAHTSGRLTLHAANLDDAHAFDEIFADCHGVAHLSHVSNYGDPEYVARVCRQLISSVNKSQSVARVVVTSSIAAVISEADLAELVKRPVLYEGRYPDDSHPKRTAQRQGYSIAKVLSEQLFSDAAEQSGRWDAIACCPGDNVGPIMSAHQQSGGPWQYLIGQMLRGECQQTFGYRPWMPVDVRDDADCHVRLLESGEVTNGERFIAWSTERVNVEDICTGIDRLLPELRHATPPVTDTAPEKVKQREAEARAVWAGCDLRNDRIRAATGVSFRPFDDSLRDCVESLLSVARIAPKRRPG